MSRAGRILDLATRIGQECKLIWAAVNGKVSEGDVRLYNQRVPVDNSVTTTKLAAMYKSVISMSALNVNWESGQVFTKTLTANSTLTFSNLHIGVKDLEIAGNYILGLPVGFKIISGEYDGTVLNFIQVICTNTSVPSGWVVICQETS